MQDIIFLILILAVAIMVMEFLARAHFEIVMWFNRKYKERNGQ